MQHRPKLLRTTEYPKLSAMPTIHLQNDDRIAISCRQSLDEVRQQWRNATYDDAPTRCPRHGRVEMKLPCSTLTSVLSQFTELRNNIHALAGGRARLCEEAARAKCVHPRGPITALAVFGQAGGRYWVANVALVWLLRAVNKHLSQSVQRKKV
ncbi:hypothetical protein BIW11_02953 [Tropilaelaps mercedesae]|uniref:Uncharacterized protein n=1 Tax=Tropilaelaps mercedesae TaxID=418985 RepID=A0A1V9XUF0_9ACAR|nr:hypothetical protein BIW11_02953 [Tropilaelaps mercedesae]